MATYLVINVIFLAVVIGILAGMRALRWEKRMLWLLALLFVLTAIFDSVIIMAGIVKYDPSLILGISIGAAPIEDFFYAILAGILIPSLWQRLRRRSA